MALHFHTLTVSDVRQETEDCVSVAFDIPGDLKPAFSFTQGQNITIRKQLNGEELRRNYSICTAPGEELRVAIKAMPQGRFSSWANGSLKKGDKLDILPPTGKFHVPLDPGASKNYLAFASGSGITPIMSILKTTLKTEPLSNFTLVYGNRNRKSIIFLDELENLKNKNMNRFQLIHILSREEPESELLFGRINQEKCLALSASLIPVQHYDDTFICGPEEMIFSVKEFLESQSYSPEHIHYELFTTPTDQKRSAGLNHDATTKKAEELAHIRVKIDGIVTHFDLHTLGDTILNAALKHGADLPYACKGGVCSTCRAKLVEGKVDMDLNYALEKDEVAAGFILTCQSHPLTKEVYVDFDQR